MRRERFDKSARIPVRVRNGQIEFLYDVELPPLREGAVGELVVDLRSVQDPRWKAFLVAETSVEIAPAGAFVAFGVAQDKGALKLEKHFLSFQQSLDLMGARVADGQKAEGLVGFGERRCLGVLGQLQEPLTLRLRGENLSELGGGAVEIPALKELKSPCKFPTLNQAYIAVSQSFEVERQGHTGDAFRDVYLLREQWVLLDAIRAQLEADHEDVRWEAMGLDPRKVRERIQNKGGLFPSESTLKTSLR